MDAEYSSPYSLDDVLCRIYNLDVALEQDHLSKKNLLMSLLQNFKQYCYGRSVLFSKYFQKFYLTGSYFEGLRVKDATEFDVNVVFKLPFDESCYVVNELDVPLSFATIQLKSTVHENIKFFNEKAFLISKNILKWFQSLLDCFLNSTELHYLGIKFIRTSNSGPARTVVLLYNSVWISIDLVPVFSLNASCLKKHNIDTSFNTKEEFYTCYLVPKPLKPELSHLLPPHVSEQVWRIHLPAAEKLFLDNKKNLKRVIQLAKALRDKEDWPLPSYFLKVVAIWLVKRNTNSAFWIENNVGSLFLLYLRALESHLRKKHLGNVFYPQFNLFHSMNDKLLKDLQVRIKKIITELKKHPSFALTLFKTIQMQNLSTAPSLFLP